jgi:hypothetical protein
LTRIAQALTSSTGPISDAMKADVSMASGQLQQSAHEARELGRATQVEGKSRPFAGMTRIRF